MAILNHIDKNTPTADLRQGLLQAANALFYGYMVAGKKCMVHTEYNSGVTRWRDWWKVTQNIIYPPCAVVTEQMRIEDIEEYTFTSQKETPTNHIVADYLFLNNNVMITEFDPTDTDHVITDYAASAMDNMIKGNIENAYAYLAAVNQLMTMAQEKDAFDKSKFMGSDIDIRPEE